MDTHLIHQHLQDSNKPMGFRIEHPNLYKTLVALLIVAILGAGAAFYFTFFANTDQAAYADQFNLEIKTYSLNGEISSSAGSIIGVRVGLIQTENGENKIVYSYKDIEVTENTKITKIKITDGQLHQTSGTKADLTVGKTVAIYTSGNPSKSDDLVADRIEIIEE